LRKKVIYKKRKGDPRRLPVGIPRVKTVSRLGKHNMARFNSPVSKVAFARRWKLEYLSTKAAYIWAIFHTLSATFRQKIWQRWGWSMVMCPWYGVGAECVTAGYAIRQKVPNQLQRNEVCVQLIAFIFCMNAT